MRGTHSLDVPCFCFQVTFDCFELRFQFLLIIDEASVPGCLGIEIVLQVGDLQGQQSVHL